VAFVFALLVFAALFVLLWKLREAPPRSVPRSAPPVRRRPPAPPRRPARSLAPDDDPEFLRELSRRMRRRDHPDS